MIVTATGCPLMMLFVETTFAPIAIRIVFAFLPGVMGPIFNGLVPFPGMLRITRVPFTMVWLGKVTLLFVTTSMEGVVAPVVMMVVEFKVPLKDVAFKLTNDLVNSSEPL